MKSKVIPPNTEILYQEQRPNTFLRHNDFKKDKCLQMVTRHNCDHSTVYKINKPLCCTLESNITLHLNYKSI